MKTIFYLTIQSDGDELSALPARNGRRCRRRVPALAGSRIWTAAGLGDGTSTAERWTKARACSRRNSRSVSCSAAARGGPPSNSMNPARSLKPSRQAGGHDARSTGSTAPARANAVSEPRQPAAVARRPSVGAPAGERYRSRELTSQTNMRSVSWGRRLLASIAVHCSSLKAPHPNSVKSSPTNTGHMFNRWLLLAHRPCGASMIPPAPSRPASDRRLLDDTDFWLQHLRLGRDA
jgi:hypothetical protein